MVTSEQRLERSEGVDSALTSGKGVLVMADAGPRGRGWSACFGEQPETTGH